MSQLMKDKMNGITNHHGDTTTATPVRARGVEATTTQTAGDTAAGTEATTQAMATSQNIILTMSMPIKGTTKASTIVSAQTSQVAKAMEHLTQALILEVATTLQPSMSLRVTKRLASEIQVSTAEVAKTASA